MRVSQRIYSSQERRMVVSNKTAVNFCNYVLGIEELRGHLFGEHIAVVGDTAIQGHGRKVSAL
jgi:hypothetical protein